MNTVYRTLFLSFNPKVNYQDNLIKVIIINCLATSLRTSSFSRIIKRAAAKQLFSFSKKLVTNSNF